MKKYRVNVNGTVFEVEIEEMTGSKSTPSTAFTGVNFIFTGRS